MVDQLAQPVKLLLAAAMAWKWQGACMIQATEAAAQAAAGCDTDWFKLLPKPGLFEPKSREEELSMWRDWWWTVHQCRCILDNSYEAEIKTIQNKLTLQKKRG